MPTSLTAHIDGDPMAWSAVAANLALIRTWANDIPLADVSDGAVRREHIVRPRILGFPVQSLEGGLQRANWRKYGTPGANALNGAEWGSRIERLVIKPYEMPAATDVWYTPIGGTFYFPKAATLDVECTLEACTRGPVADPIYPDGASGAATATCGYLRWHLINRDTGVETEYAAGDQQLYPSEFGGPSSTDEYTDHVHITLLAQLDAGVTYDAVVVYHLDETPDTLAQVDLSRIVVTGEAF